MWLVRVKATYHFAAVQPTSEILCNRLLNLTKEFTNGLTNANVKNL